MKKKTILFLSDHPLVPSGVGTQAKYLIEGLLATGKYRFICLGGAIKHPSMQPQKVAPEKYGDDWVIFPVEGHGSPEIVRQVLVAERPDALVMFTDPRFFMWLWEIEDEVRAVCPMIYWHVWDNDPTPEFNRPLYDATDRVVALSLKTYGLLQDLGYGPEKIDYVPHAVDSYTFKPLDEAEVAEFKKTHYGPHAGARFVAFWNNRNARRKQTGDVIASFADFANKVGRDGVTLMMHTSATDPEGQDIGALSEKFGVAGQLIVSEQRVEPAQLNMMYNVADVTVNISSNEGFGLGTLESLTAGTPILAHFTGGLQYQLGDWWEGETDFRNQPQLTAKAKKSWQRATGLLWPRSNDEPGRRWWGVPIFPAARSCTGSQPIPYIYDDRVSNSDVASGLEKLYKVGRPARKQLGKQAREWVAKKFNLADLVVQWDRILEGEVAKRATNPYQRFTVVAA